MTRVIDSCAGSRVMCTMSGAETRELTDGSIKWKEVADYCIKNGKYLIVTPCINDGYNKPKLPSDAYWVQRIDDICEYLQLIGGNRSNCRLSIINEPMKYCTKEQYAHYIELAYPIVNGYGFLMGAGNEEFFTAQAKGFMYQYILNERMAGKINFDILDIHIQGSCSDIELLNMWVAEVKSWKNYWQVPVDCPEAFYGNITTQNGYDLLVEQYKAAQELECENFGNVFNNMDTSVFPILSDPRVRDRWFELCFNINSQPHSPFWTSWKTIAIANEPIPNIPEEVFDMYGIEINYVKPGSHNEETRAIQQIMLDEGYDLSPFGADSWYGDITEDAIKAWQEDNGLTVDGIVGKQTWQWIFENIDTGVMRFMQMLARTARYL